MEPKKTRCVGLLGGVGVGASSHYYREIAREAEARGVELDLVMVHAETPRVMAYVQNNDRQGLEAYFNPLLRRMRAAGAELVVIPSVTCHFCMQELAASSPLPLAAIFDPIAAEANLRSIRRVAIFGTRFVVESNLFGQVPCLDYVLPRAEEIDIVHDTYLRLALEGRGTQEQYHRLRELALRLCARERLDAIVLGGTDLSLIFHAGNTDFPVIDCAALHLRAVAGAIFT